MMYYTYTSDQLLEFRRVESRPNRRLRKLLMKLYLWLPMRDRISLNGHDESGVFPGPMLVNESDDQSPSMNVNNRSKRNYITVGSLNARSIRNKTAALTLSIADNDLDILAITETWCESSDDVGLKRITPDGYACLDCPREASAASHAGHRGGAYGGVALIYRNNFRSRKVKFDFEPKTFEYLTVMFTLSGVHTLVAVIYRPGSKPVNDAFLNEFCRLLEMMVINNSRIIVTGDVNIHLDVHDNTMTQKFNGMLDDFDLCQSVLVPTHTAGHTLDVFITSKSNPLKSLVVHPPDVSDHSLIIADLPIIRSKPPAHYATVRGWKKMDHEKFRQDLVSSCLCSDPDVWSNASSDEMSEIYDRILTELVDKHAPQRTVRKHYRPITPWFNEACRSQKRRTRCFERIYR